MASTNEEVVFCDEPPTIKISKGVVQIRYRGATVRALCIRDFARGIDRAQRALKCYSAGQETVIIDD